MQARKSSPEKNSQRDPRGRYLRGVSGNARGRPPITPEQKAVRELAAVERTSNIARLVHLRDHAKDGWLQLEAIRVLLQYSDGKPVTAIGGPLLNVNIGANAGGGSLDPIEAVVTLATQGDSMPDEQRAHLVRSVFDRAEAAAQRVAERRRAVVIDTRASEPASASMQAIVPAAAAGASAPIAAPAAPAEAVEMMPQPLPPEVQIARDAWIEERTRGGG